MTDAAAAEMADERTIPEQVSRAATSAFWVMFAITLFNYLDR